MIGVIVLLWGVFGGIPLFHSWWENLVSHVTHDIEGTQDAILDPL